MILSLHIIFFVALLWLGYIYLGYPMLLKVAGTRKYTARAVDALEEAEPPTVTVFVPAFNEEAVIEAKIRSLLDCDYPAQKLEILVASDASSDQTDALVSGFDLPNVKLMRADENGGKNALINRFIPESTGEVLVFTDANAMFDKDALSRLVRWFGYEEVDCVGGRLVYVVDASLTAKGEGAYYKYENLLRAGEAADGCLIGANGALYAIRRAAFVDVPNHVPNDFFHPLCVLARQRQAVFEPRALAYEKATEESAQEFRRRSRIVTRALATYAEVRRVAGSLRGRALLYYLSHRQLRWYGFFAFAALLISSGALALAGAGWFYWLAFAGVAGLCGAAALGWWLSRKGKSPKLLTIPFYFMLINLAAVTGIWNYHRGRKIGRWKPAESTR